MHRTRTTLAVVALSAAVAAGCLVTAGSAAATGKPTLPGGNTRPEGAGISAAVKAYRSAYPNLTQTQALTAARQQDARRTLAGKLSSPANAKTFGGAWFDPPTGVTHVGTTTAASARAAAAAGARLGLTVKTHTVKRSFAALEKQASGLRTGRTALSRQAAGRFGIDVRTNQVTAAVPAAARAALQRSAAVPAGVKLVEPDTDVEADAGCTARNACDWTIRAGSMLWRQAAGNNVCSVGFTARNSVGRFVFTAGHCSNGNGVGWGTGGLPIGPMQASIDSGVYDAAIIRVTNSWFAGDQGGEIYHSAYVNGVAPTLSYIWAGDTVCLSANYTQPTGGNFCGVIGSNADASVRGMARVNGLDACPGDSGGGWYWLTSAGKRIAYGLHSRSDGGCHGDAGGTRSWFTPLPTVKSGWTPSLNVEVRP